MKQTTSKLTTLTARREQERGVGAGRGRQHVMERVRIVLPYLSITCCLDVVADSSASLANAATLSFHQLIASRRSYSA